jgi:4,5-DOPA dioxygenase extradiol
LRREGVLVVASGSATHNLRDVRWDEPSGPPPRYVLDFDAWLDEAVRESRVDALIDYAQQGPFAAKNHPTPEHFLPLLVSLGMGGEPRRLHAGFTLGVLSMAAFAWE